MSLQQPPLCQRPCAAGRGRGHASAALRCAASAPPAHASPPPAGSSLVESSRGARPELGAAIEGVIAAKACVTASDLRLGRSRKVGKVRDTYDCGDCCVFVTTDRQSAFDRLLAAVPFKGRVLNTTSAWWFERTRHLVPNALLAVPHPNVAIMKRCAIFPVEFVVRGYMTGSTSTSIWTAYSAGAREYCGQLLPDGLRKGDPLPAPMVTPTTKSDTHDALISGAEIVAQGLMSEAHWERACRYALTLFAVGQAAAAERGLLLVDTKYEFGVSAAGDVLLCDEVHTPDSSRYWVASTYADRHSAGLEPESVDKEFLRLWFAERCDPYGTAPLPAAPRELVAELARRYVLLHDTITGSPLPLPPPGETAKDAADKMRRDTEEALKALRAPGGSLALANT